MVWLVLVDVCCLLCGDCVVGVGLDVWCARLVVGLRYACVWFGVGCWLMAVSG